MKYFVPALQPIIKNSSNPELIRSDRVGARRIVFHREKANPEWNAHINTITEISSTAFASKLGHYLRPERRKT